MYTDVDDIVAAVIAIYDSTDEAGVHNLSTRQARVIHYLQRTVEDVWFHRAWPFAMGSDTLTMAAGAATLPTDFGRISIEGGLFDSIGIGWVEITYQDMAYLRGRRLRQQGRLYAVGSTVQVVDVNSTADFTFVYQKQAPTQTSGGATGLPQAFGQVLLLGTVTKLKEEEGDARSIWRADYQRILGQVGTLYVKASRPQQMPQTIGGMW